MLQSKGLFVMALDIGEDTLQQGDVSVFRCVACGICILQLTAKQRQKDHGIIDSDLPVMLLNMQAKSGKNLTEFLGAERENIPHLLCPERLGGIHLQI